MSDSNAHFTDKGMRAPRDSVLLQDLPAGKGARRSEELSLDQAEIAFLYVRARQGSGPAPFEMVTHLLWPPSSHRVT